MTPPLNNEQKLDAIYTMLRDQEKARSRALWWGLFRRIAFYGAILFLMMNPWWLIEKIMDSVKPMITEMTNQMMEEQKAKLEGSLDSQMESLKSRLGR